MAIMTYASPILLEPWFDLAFKPIRVPLADVPTDLLTSTALPDSLGEMFASHVSAEPEPALVLRRGAHDFTGAREQLLELAPYLPDLRLLVHYEEPSRGTLCRLDITEVVVHAHDVMVRDWPIGEYIARARFYDFSRGGQLFDTVIELLLAAAARGAARPELFEHVEGMTGYDFDIALGQTMSVTAPVLNLPKCAHHSDALDQLGRGSVSLRRQREQLMALAAPGQVKLSEWVRARRQGAPAAAIPAARQRSRTELGSLPELESLLDAAGPGPLTASTVLLDYDDAVAETRRARAESGWPPELVVVGAIDGARLCLDTRYQPSPVVRQTAEGYREMADGLFAFLAWECPD
jgi:hypothetical protein